MDKWLYLSSPLEEEKIELNLSFEQLDIKDIETKAKCYKPFMGVIYYYS